MERRMRDQLDSKKTKNAKNMADAQLLRLLLGKMTSAEFLEILEPSGHQRLLLIRGLPSDADDVGLTSLFWPYDLAPLVAVERLIGMAAPADQAVKRPEAPPGFTGKVVEILEGVHTIDTDPECSYNTALQKASVHDAAGDEIDINQGYSLDEVKQILLSLPRKSQEKLVLDVVTAMGSSFLAHLQNQQQASVQDMNCLESQHVVDIESISQHMQDSNDNPNERTQQNAGRQWGMWRSLLCSVTASAISHIVLYVLVKKLERGENKNVENKKITKTEWMNWLWEKIVAPVCMGLVMCLLRVYVIGAEEKRIAPQYTNNAMANLAINSASKIAYFAIKELPILVGDLYLLGHLVSFIIDLLGAFYLWWRRGYHDPDVPDS